MKKKIFEQLPKGKNSYERIDKFGRIVDFREYGKKVKSGWLIVDGEAVNINTVKVICSWEKSR